jgi:hypothetical protein
MLIAALFISLIVSKVLNLNKLLFIYIIIYLMLLIIILKFINILVNIRLFKKLLRLLESRDNLVWLFIKLGLFTGKNI